MNDLINDIECWKYWGAVQGPVYFIPTVYIANPYIHFYPGVPLYGLCSFQAYSGTNK